MIQLKVCTKCGIGKPLREFYGDNRKKDKKQPWCKTCSDLASKNFYRKRHMEWQDFLGKDRLTCMECGYNKCRAAIEFHHRNPEEKVFEIGRWIQYHSCNNQNKKLVLEEVDKCDSLCATCHRELHYYKTHPEEKGVK